MEHEVYDYTGNNWSQRSSNKTFKQAFGSHLRKTFNRLPEEDSFSWNITHSALSMAVKSLKSEGGVTVGSRGEVPSRSGLWQETK